MEEQRLVYIYTLADPRTDVVRYVGYSKNPTRRLKIHLKDNNDVHKGRWIRKLLRDGITPVMNIIEKCLPGEDFKDIERQWIKSYRYAGYSLTNETAGGDGVIDPSPEARAKNSAANIGNQRALGHVHTLAERAKQSAAQMGKKRKHTPEHCAKISTAQMGNTYALGYVQTPEHRAKESAAKTGKKHTPEHCAKTSAGLVGNKNALGNKNRTGKRNTPEQKAKQSITMKAIWTLRRVQKQDGK